MRLAIVCDSTCDLPPKLLAKYNIFIIPAILVIEGQEFEDGRGMTRTEFYNRLPFLQTPPTTASPSAGSFIKTYEMLFNKGYSHILSIHAASTLSALHNTAILAAKSFDKQVTVIDSGQVSLGLGFQALAAGQASREGANINEIINQVEATRARIRLIAMLNSLKQLRRSGRVSWARANLSSLLRIKPFIELRNGEVQRLGEARSRSKGISRLINKLKDLEPFERLAILHTNAEHDARFILESINPQSIHSPIVINVTTIIGTHVGVNGLGFAALRKNI